MLPRENRFSRREFEFHRTKMKAFRVEGFLFLYTFRPQKKSKYAAVISKKIDKRAVRRNYFRRHLYRAFQTELLPKSEGFLVIGLYKGDTIPENAYVYKKAVRKLSNYLSQKIKP